MADGRILHRAAGESAKVTALSDFEYRVWTQYTLSADDFGLMVAEATRLQADNRSLRSRTAAKVQAALGTVIGIGLLSMFNHQAQPYVWQIDWQDYQGIRYPRATVNPKPPEDVFTLASEQTRKLFEKHFTRARQGFREVAETLQHPAGAGGRETLTLTPTHTQTPGSGSGSSEKSARETNAAVVAHTVQRLPGRHAASLIGKHHLCPPGTWGACERGVCVPGFLAAEWRAQCGGDDATIGPFVDAVIAESPDGPLGDPVKFWRAAWDAKFRVKTAHGGSRTGDTMAAARSLLREG